MATTPALHTQIAAIQARIDALAPDASSEDIVMLAKAVEAVGGQTTVFDVLATAAEQQDQLVATTSTKSAELVAEGDSQVARVVAQGDAKHAELSAELQTYAAFTGASDDTDGALGMVPAPVAGEQLSFLRGDGGWAASPVPLGALALHPPALNGSDYLIADGGLILQAAYPDLVDLLGTSRNQFSSAFGGSTGGTVMLGSGYCVNATPEGVFYDPEILPNFMATRGSSGWGLSLDNGATWSSVDESQSSLGVMAFSGSRYVNLRSGGTATSLNYGVRSGTALTSQGNIGNASGDTNSYGHAIGTPTALLVAFRNGSGTAHSRIFRMLNSGSGAPTQVTLPVVAQDLDYSGQFYRLAGQLFMMVYLRNPTRHRMLVSADDGLTWRFATDTATGAELDCSSARQSHSSDYQQGDWRHPVLIAAGRAVIQSATGGWSSTDGETWTPFTHLNIGSARHLFDKNGTYYLVGTTAVVTTTDFLSFQTLITNTVAFNGNNWEFSLFGVGAGGYLAFSTQGNNPSDGLRLFTSPDLVTWTQRVSYASGTSSHNPCFLPEADVFLLYAYYASNSRYFGVDLDKPGTHYFGLNSSMPMSGLIMTGPDLLYGYSSGLMRYMLANYNRATELRLPNAPTVSGFTWDGQSAAFKYNVRVR